MRLGWYGKDITEYEHADEIMKCLKSYENDKKRELEEIQKVIRDWEDRFPGIVESPAAAFEIEKVEKHENKRSNDDNQGVH